MNAKKALTIGLLAITAIGLVGCAIVLGKYKDQYQPKTLQANAEYQFTDYNDTNKTWTLTGETPTINPSGEYEIYTTTENAYGFVKTSNTNINVLLVAKKIYNAYGEEQTIQKQMLSSITINSQKVVKEIKIVHEATEQTSDENDNILWDFSYSITAIYVDDLTATPIYTYFTISENELSIELIQTEVPYTMEIIGINQTLSVLHTTYENGYTSGAENGYQDGYEAGEEYGYQTGYTAGYQTAGDISDGNFLSLKDLMLNILTMPFTFINQAFNLTLWPGTNHSFNVGLFIRTIIAISAILFIIRMFTSGFSLLGNYTGGFTDKRLDRQQKKANIAKTKAETANIGKPKESHVYTHKEK